MSKKNNISYAAIIEIGSNEIRLKIGQNKKGNLVIIESLMYPNSIGRDTFNNGKISFDKADKACEIIKNYTNVASEYGITSVRAVATTALREASNNEYILDQIRLKTMIDVEVIDNLDEKFYIYKLMLALMNQEDKQSCLMAYIGSGNLGVSILKKQKIPYIQNIKVGSSRISEMFENLQDYSQEFYLVMEEYLNSFTDILSVNIPEKLDSFVASGNEIVLIASLCGGEQNGDVIRIEKDRFLSFYEEVKNKRIDRIMTDYGLSSEKADLLIPAMCICKNLLLFTNAKYIISPHVFLIDAVLFSALYPEEFAEIDKSFYKNTAISAKAIAERFNASEKHYNLIETFSLKIFDKIKKIHGLGLKERVLLQAAAILHDIGKAINGTSHYIHSYNIVRGLDIFGLNESETELVACICLYHSRFIPMPEDKIYSSLNSKKRVIVAKLSAILRIADSLDRSHEQKLQQIDVKITDDELQISFVTERNIELEEWSFKEKSNYFEEVFGLKAVLKKKRSI